MFKAQRDSNQSQEGLDVQIGKKKKKKKKTFLDYYKTILSMISV